MNNGLGALCDDFYASCRLFLRLEMNLERDTVLHFFDRLRKDYPGLQKLRRREGGSLLLEEEPTEQGTRRWLRLDPAGLRFGQHSPRELDDVRRFGQAILQQAPYHLSFSEIDFDHLEVIYGFDLEYRGNHDQLVAETLMGEQNANSFLFGDHAMQVIDAQPYFGIALSPACDLQAYVEVKSRTTTYEVRGGAYEPAPISVYLTVRKYWNVEESGSLEAAMRTLFDLADELATEKIVPHFVNPLAAAIASRS